MKAKSIWLLTGWWLGLLATSVFAPGLSAMDLSAGTATSGTVQIHVDAKGQGTAFPHFWEQMFGSGRAVLALRDDYRADLSAVQQATGFSYIRFHGIFDDDVGLFHLDGNGKPVYNFSYVDQI